MTSIRRNLIVLVAAIAGGGIAFLMLYVWLGHL
jgi:hypothetical protein